MSTKQLLVQAIEAMPETLTVEEAVERLYRAFKRQHGDSAAASSLQSLAGVAGRRPEYTLTELLAGITADNLHDESATGAAVGAELF